MYEDAKEAKLEKPSFLETVPAFGCMVTFFKENIFNKLKVRFHDSKRYTLNIRGIIEEHYKLYPFLIPQMNQKTEYWQEYNKIEGQFKALSIKQRVAIENFIQKTNPSFNKDTIHETMLKIRENMTYDSDASRLLSYGSKSTTTVTNASDKEVILQRREAFKKQFSINKITGIKST